MKAAVYYNNNDIRIEEYPVPGISGDELLIRVEASGICGSDLMEWYRVPKAPLVLGHEVTGTVVEKGKYVNGFHEGDRVVVTHHVPCNTCRFCLSGRHTNCDFIRSTNFDPGGFAEYLRIPGINVDRGTFRLPEGVSFEEGTFTEPLGCVVRGQRLADMSPGKSVAVIGSGVTGILNLQYSIALGAAFTCAIDISDNKLQFAKDFGASEVYNADDNVAGLIKSRNDGMLADLVVVCTGAESAVYQGFDIVEKGGTVLLFAPGSPGFEFSVNFNRLWWSGIRVVSSYAAAPHDMREALDLISNNRVNVSDMITDRIALSDISEGFRSAERSDNNLKIVVLPSR